MMAQQPVAPPPFHPRDLDAKTLTNWWTAIRAPANTVSPPATSAAPGIAGQIAFDANFLYVCVQSNAFGQNAIWKRIPLIAF